MEGGDKAKDHSPWAGPEAGGTPCSQVGGIPLCLMAGGASGRVGLVQSTGT